MLCESTDQHEVIAKKSPTSQAAVKDPTIQLLLPGPPKLARLAYGFIYRGVDEHGLTINCGLDT